MSIEVNGPFEQGDLDWLLENAGLKSRDGHWDDTLISNARANRILDRMEQLENERDKYKTYWEDLAAKTRQDSRHLNKLDAERIAELEADVREAMEWNWQDENFEAWPEEMNRLADKYWCKRQGDE